MRYDDKHKAKTHKRILDEAAAAIREHGPHQIGVSALMAKAGLTHGGFYAHFKSKDQLVAEAITQMFDERHEFHMEYVRNVPPERALKRLINGYLSTQHRDAPESGCPLPALSGDVSRMKAMARKRFTAGAERMIDMVAELLEQLGRSDARDLASSAVAEMAGALALSRAVADEAQSNQILARSRNAIRTRLQLGAFKQLDS